MKKSASAGAIGKNEVRCASACETIIKVRVCVCRTVKYIATQHLFGNDYLKTQILSYTARLQTSI